MKTHPILPSFLPLGLRKWCFSRQREPFHLCLDLIPSPPSLEACLTGISLLHLSRSLSLLVSSPFLPKKNDSWTPHLPLAIVWLLSYSFHPSFLKTLLPPLHHCSYTLWRHKDLIRKSHGHFSVFSLLEATVASNITLSFLKPLPWLPWRHSLLLMPELAA